MKLLKKTIEVEVPTAASDADPINLRIEIYASASRTRTRYWARVFRYDQFRLSLLQLSDKTQIFADHEMLILDPSFGYMELAASSLDAAWGEVVRNLDEQLGVNVGLDM
jgi:hypothetical protein